ncbi:MAG TPA: tetratricopeptide repeat protein [Candidatus Atribacteria bacterium]|nr:tetratricopeptide repeat protein [Candidatus Atribacteria bacterium]
MDKYKIENINFYQKITLNMLKLSILFTPLVANKYVDRYLINQETWLKLFIVLGGGIYLISFLREENITFKRNKISLPLVLLFLIVIFSFIKNGFSMSILHDGIIFLAYFILYFLILKNIKNQYQFKSFIQLFFLTSFIIALYTILHYYDFISYLQEYGKVASLIGQKNWISNYIALIFPLMFSFYLLEKVKKKKMIHFISLSFLYTALIICQSRGIWISLSLSLLFGVFLIFKFNSFHLFKENKKWLILLLISFIIITLIYSIDNPLNISPLTVTQRVLSTFEEKDPSINTRILMWRVTGQMIKDKPLLGGGIGSFKINYLDYQAGFLKEHPEYNQYWTNAKEAHNEYLQIGAEIGLFGLGIILLLILKLYSLFINFLKKETDSKRKLIFWGLLIGMTSFLIHNLFTFPLHVPALGSAFFVILGLSAAYIRNYDLSEERDQEKDKNDLMNGEKKRVNRSRLPLLYTILVLLIVLVLINDIVVRPYLAEVYAYQGEKYFEDDNNIESALKYTSAHKLDPFNGRTLFNLGVNYYILMIYGEAEKIFKESKKYYNDKNIYGNLGLCYMKMGDYPRAEEEFKYAIYLDPRFTQAYSDLGLLYFEKENYDESIDQWKKILEIEPNFAENYSVLANLGVIYEKKKMPDKALEYLLQALQLVPEGDPIEKEIEEEINKIYKSKL